MKYLLITVFVLVMVWLWRHNRAVERAQRDAPAAPRRGATRPAALPVTEVVACQVCDVHLPRGEAVITSQGAFCSDAHRRQAEGR